MEPAPPSELRRLVTFTDDPELPRMLTASTVARMFGKSPKAFREWRSRGGGPPGRQFGNRWMYVEADVLAWIKAHPTTD